MAYTGNSEWERGEGGSGTYNAQSLRGGGKPRNRDSIGVPRSRYIINRVDLVGVESTSKRLGGRRAGGVVESVTAATRATGRRREEDVGVVGVNYHSEPCLHAPPPN